MKKLGGKAAFISGAGRGIGRGCAVELARHGADVAVNFLEHPHEAEKTAALVDEAGGRAILLQGDVTDPHRVASMMDDVRERLGGLDILVANAAFSIRKPFLELTFEEAQKTFDPTFWGVFHCGQAAARIMVEQGRGGSIVAISSLHALIPVPRSVAYNSAKAAVNQLARTMAAELVSHRIRVNTIEPGWIDTPGERNFYTEEELREGGKRLPWGRLGTPEDIARAVAFLVGPEAEYVTGSALRVDGGYMLTRT